MALFWESHRTDQEAIHTRYAPFPGVICWQVIAWIQSHASVWREIGQRALLLPSNLWWAVSWVARCGRQAACPMNAVDGRLKVEKFVASPAGPARWKLDSHVPRILALGGRNIASQVVAADRCSNSESQGGWFHSLCGACISWMTDARGSSNENLLL